MNGGNKKITSDILNSIETRAEYDPLTETYNRNAADANIREYFKLHPDDTAALAIISVSDMREINSRYGHHIGDVILRSAAKLIERHAGSESVIGRNNGSEFIALLEDRDEAEAGEVMRKLASAKRIVEYEGGTYEYTFAIGYALYPEQGILLHDLAAKAYSAMERSKNAGGDVKLYE